VAKAKNVFVCQNCGNKSPKWVGKCTACGEWNSFEEEVELRDKDLAALTFVAPGPPLGDKPLPLDEIPDQDLPRLDTRNQELNRVLGGGLVPGSMILLGGEPGIGKSTLVLQLALGLGALRTLYVSGEESPRQIKLRAERLPQKGQGCLILSENSLEKVLHHAHTVRPDLLVVDSIQTLQTQSLEATPGSISQIRECASQLMRLAKGTHLPVLLIGHINKEGGLAGPKVLEHMVDVVLQFEGDNQHVYRVLRATKNRFGSTAELGIFEMSGQGLREVPNPSELLLSQRDENLSGVAVAASLEGMRPFLIEIQALVGTAAYGTPQRSATGFDLRRLSMLLAVLEKRAGFKLASKDVFLNIAGGIRTSDPANDLAVVCSILSSDLDLALPRHACFAGEVGLSGEIRPVNRVEQRVKEARKLGFRRIFLSKYNAKGLEEPPPGIELVFCAKVEDAFRELFAG